MTGMLPLLLAILQTGRSSLKSQRQLALENLALRQQLAMLRRSVRRARVSPIDRWFWVLFSKNVSQWRATLYSLHPDTVVRWHRKRFRRYWHLKSRPHREGQPSIAPEIRKFIRQMQAANVGWGAPRIHGELLKLGIEISQGTVSNYMKRRVKPPSQSWRTLLNNHAEDVAAIDFFTVPTATFRILYVFVVLLHDRRHIVHFNVTEHPSARWTAQQIVEAFSWDIAPRYFLRDRDGIYGSAFQRRVKSMSIDEVKTAPRSPWQNSYVERVIGSVRRDCLDHVVILNEWHLRRLLQEYVSYYHGCRTHLSLNKDPPDRRAVELPESGNIVAFPCVGGLHHRYARLAA